MEQLTENDGKCECACVHWISSANAKVAAREQQQKEPECQEYEQWNEMKQIHNIEMNPKSNTNKLKRLVIFETF